MSNINLAIEFASIAHRNQFRKGTNIPYISHPFAVGMMLQKENCEEEVVIAGILHDIVEDTEITLKELSLIFGEKVSTLVDKCTEKNKKLSWEERKSDAIQKVKTADKETCFIICADKLHNLLSIQEDLKKNGAEVWSRFNRGREKQKWYYESVMDNLEQQIGDENIFKQLKTAIYDVFV
ncbi:MULTISPECIES: HD domain-containing protein [Sutcliffiella]|uniref:Phosphohydrolase n=1 Tax=Sutcliffiella cohnii TaxID=33932 RepID=A0A223KR60_9BACI|nr:MULTISPECIES: HD domain-containing protein [Sutcliffiella]AST91828.1 phosphohydrolase [Sutcliffiella cohnii]MED4018636.1 HD domain-containing protein [Sutcliffiella cohnii]WBL13049.1 HD domain-containing protein [Sutcliffiella sp. NC1]